MEDEVSKALDEVAAQLRAGEPEAGYAALSRLMNAQERDVLYPALIARLGDPSFRVGASFAIAAGALVESGADPQPLGSAIRAPLTRALTFSKKCITLAEELEDEEAIEDGVEIGDAQLSPETMRALIARDPAAVDAFFSIGTWARPAVACWTRSPIALREAGADATFQEALAGVRDAVEGGFWLAALSLVLQGARFVVVLPELQKSYTFELDGCTDVGQLLVLLAGALSAELAPLGCASRAPEKAVLDVMSGAGPQMIEGLTHAVDFHLVLPQERRSLPADFLPAAIEPLEDGTRLLVMVGPRAVAGHDRLVATGGTASPDRDPKAGQQSMRSLSAARMFDQLRARIDHLRLLSAEETDTWMARLR